MFDQKILFSKLKIRAVNITQVVDHQPSKHKVLSLNPRIAKI
jgi:hypothetical protein